MERDWKHTIKSEAINWYNKENNFNLNILLNYKQIEKPDYEGKATIIVKGGIFLKVS